MAAQIGSLFVSLTADIKPFATEFSRAATITRSTANSIRRDVNLTEASVARLRGSMGKSGNYFSPGRILAASRAFDSLNSRTDLLRAALLSTTAAFGGLAAAMTSNVILRYADTSTKITNSLKVVTKSTTDLIATQRALSASSNDARASLQASATLFSRITKVAPERSADQILKITSTVQKALQLGGASAQETASAMLQLSQGLASNRLGGEELRAVLETPLGLELAKGLGVTIGEFRELSIQGKLTADVILGALTRIAPEIDRQFSRTARTLDQALTIADNNITNYIGGLNEAYNVTGNLGEAIIYLSENLDVLGGALSAVGLTLGTVFAGRLFGRAAGGAQSKFQGIVQDFRDIKTSANENLKAASRDLRELQDRLRDVQNQRTQAAVRAIYPMENASPAQMKAYQQAVAAAAKAEQDHLASVHALATRTAELGAVQTQVSTRAASLVDKQVKAEEKLRKLQIERNLLFMDLQDNSEARQRALYGGMDAGPVRTVIVNSIREQEREIKDAMAKIDEQIVKQQEVVAQRVAAVGNLTVEAERKAADERLKIQQDILNKRLEAEAKLADLTRRRQAVDSAKSNIGLEVGQRSIEEARALDQQIITLNRTIDTANSQMAAMQRQSSSVARAWSFLKGQGASLLGVLGGPWGVAFTGAIASIAFFAEQSLKAEAASEKFTQQLREMGLIAAQTEEALKSLGERRIEVAREQIREGERQIKQREEELEGLASTALGQRAFRSLQNSPIGDAYKAFADLVEQFRAGKISAKEAEDALNDLTRDDYGADFDSWTVRAKQLLEELDAAPKAISKFQSELRNIERAQFGAEQESPGDYIHQMVVARQEQATYEQKYRDELMMTERQQKVAAEAARILEDEKFKGTWATRELADALAEENIRYQENAEKIREAEQAAKAYSATLNSMVQANAYDVSRAQENPFDPAAEAARQRFLTDIAMANALKRAAPDEQLVSGAKQNPYRDVELARFVRLYREELERTSRESEVLAEKERLLADETFRAAGGTEELAGSLAEQSVRAAETAAEISRLQDEYEQISDTLNSMVIPSIHDMNMALRNPFDPETQKRYEEWRRDLQMAAAIKPPAEDLVSAAQQNPFVEEQAEAYLKTITDTSRQARVAAEAEELYNQALQNGTPITMEQARVTAELLESRKELADVPVPTADPRKSLDYVDPYKEFILSQQDFLRGLDLERSTLGMNKTEAEALRRAYQLIMDAKQRFGTLTEEQQQQLAMLASREVVLTDQTAKLRAEMEDFAKSAEEGFKDIGQSMAEAIFGMKSWKNVLSEALKILIDIGSKWLGPKVAQWLGVSNVGIGTPESVAGAITPAVKTFVGGTNDVSSAGTAVGGALEIGSRFRAGVDPRLMDILNTASQRYPGRVEAVSGVRPGDPRQHGRGLAADVQLYDSTGKALPNYQDAASFRAYEEFAQEARRVQMEKYPELNDQFRWGGYFSGPKGKYGAADLMHFDLNGRVGMGGGTWAGGLSAAQRGYFPGAVSMGMTEEARAAAASLSDLSERAKMADSGLVDFGNALKTSAGGTAPGGIPLVGGGGPLDLGQMAQGGGILANLGQAFSSIFQNIGSALGGLLQGGGGILSTILGFILHDGGTVGATSAVRAVPAGAFAGAPRYHTGLRSDELPAILQKGERVLTARQWDRTVSTMSGLAARGGSIADNRSLVHRGGDLIVQGNVTEDVLPKVQAMLQENNVQQRKDLERNWGTVGGNYMKRKG